MKIASATFPDHILDDIRGKLKLVKDASVVSVTNDRPNIALSYQVMKHSKDSKADLRFLIPKTVTKPEDIDISLVYCNQWLMTEDACDNLCRWAADAGLHQPETFIAFYHAKVGSVRKCELEELLCKGKICILVCTDAVGMVCKFFFCILVMSVNFLQDCDM